MSAGVSPRRRSPARPPRLRSHMPCDRTPSYTRSRRFPRSRPGPKHRRARSHDPSRGSLIRRRPLTRPRNVSAPVSAGTGWATRTTPARRLVVATHHRHVQRDRVGPGRSSSSTLRKSISPRSAVSASSQRARVLHDRPQGAPVQTSDVLADQRAVRLAACHVVQLEIENGHDRLIRRRVVDQRVEAVAVEGRSREQIDHRPPRTRPRSTPGPARRPRRRDRRWTRRTQGRRSTARTARQVAVTSNAPRIRSARPAAL